MKQFQKIFPSIILTAFSLCGSALAEANSPDMSEKYKIRGIQDIVTRPDTFSTTDLALIIIAVICFLVFCGFLFLYYRKKGQASPSEAPSTVAKKALNDARSILDDKGTKTYLEAVSIILKNYLEQQFSCHCRPKTTTELLSDIQKQAIPELEKHTSFLQTCFETMDRIKFANTPPERHEIDTLEEKLGAFFKAGEDSSADRKEKTE